MRTFCKTFILSLFVLGASTAAKADLFRFGVKLGMNINTLHLSNIQDNFHTDNGCGFTGGLMTELNIPGIGLGADISLLYSHMSGDFTTSDPENPYYDKKIYQTKNFIEIPINLKYKFSLPIVSPFIVTGPSFAFSMGEGNFVSSDVQYSWNFGAGLEIVKHLQIQAAYSLGINNIAKRFADNAFDGINIRNNYWTITAAYLF